MVQATEAIIKAAARADRTITPDQLRAGLDALAGKSVRAFTNAEPLGRVLSREEVARMLPPAKTRKGGTANPVKRVDRLCRLGVLQRVYPTYPDGTKATRATGITEASYRAFVAGAANNTTTDHDSEGANHDGK